MCRSNTLSLSLCVFLSTIVICGGTMKLQERDVGVSLTFEHCVPVLQTLLQDTVVSVRHKPPAICGQERHKAAEGSYWSTNFLPFAKPKTVLLEGISVESKWEKSTLPCCWKQTLTGQTKVLQSLAAVSTSVSLKYWNNEHEVTEICGINWS